MYPFADENIKRLTSEKFTINGEGPVYRAKSTHPTATRNVNFENNRKPAFEMYLGPGVGTKTVVKATALAYTFFLEEGDNSNLTVEYIDKKNPTSIDN